MFFTFLYFVYYASILICFVYLAIDYVYNDWGEVVYKILFALFVVFLTGVPFYIFWPLAAYFALEDPNHWSIEKLKGLAFMPIRFTLRFSKTILQTIQSWMS